MEYTLIDTKTHLPGVPTVSFRVPALRIKMIVSKKAPKRDAS